MNYKQDIPEDVQAMIDAIGEQIEQGREKKNMSQQQLAEALGCSLKYVQRMERGGVHFRLNLLIALFDVLEINLLKFLDWEFMTNARLQNDPLSRQINSK